MTVMERINILWTGGFDSTFRICQLSLLPVEIQAYYISAGKRSEPQELEAMALITDQINKHPLKRCKLLALDVVKLEDIEPDQQIKDAYNKIRKEVVIGTQYEWLARFARQEGIHPELGFEKDEASPLDAYFKEKGTIRELSIPLEGGEDTLDYCEFDPDQTSEALTLLFGQLRFGLPLYKMNKLQTVEAFKLIGYESVMPLTWFCAFPFHGKPCGLCNPCATVMKTGMSFRMPFLSKVLYYMFKANSVGRFVDKELKAIYNRLWR
jgi:7-cyano-7-deazaguanine synthase in queuosine biosynthesis